MYRRNDPRFRRRLNELSNTLESANESAQSNLYTFGQHYVVPCFQSIGSCMTTCVDASCPTLNLSQRDRLRRQRGRGRSRGRAELSFDFYDDWDDEGDDSGLLGWGNEEFDRLLAGSTGYGTVTATGQPGRQRGMSYPKGRRKSIVQDGDNPTVIPSSSGFFGRLFGGKALRYRPSAADLQDHPGARRLGKQIPEGQALIEGGEASDDDGGGRKHRRIRSNTAGSRETADSYSSRGDIFPSDDEDDAVPLDDGFAMVLERRTTQSGPSVPETESSSYKSGRPGTRRGKRPSAASRKSTSRTVSSQSTRSSRRKSRSSRNSSAAQTPREGAVEEELVPTLLELKREEVAVEQEEEAEVARKRQEAQRLAAERGLTDSEHGSRREETPHSNTSAPAPNEPTQLPTPLPTDDEDEQNAASPALPLNQNSQATDGALEQPGREYSKDPQAEA